MALILPQLGYTNLEKCHFTQNSLCENEMEQLRSLWAVLLAKEHFVPLKSYKRGQSISELEMRCHRGSGHGGSASLLTLHCPLQQLPWLLPLKASESGDLF